MLCTMLTIYIFRTVLMTVKSILVRNNGLTLQPKRFNLTADQDQQILER